MSKENEISATEKLLEMIRGEQSADQTSASDSDVMTEQPETVTEPVSLAGLSLESAAPPEIPIDPPIVTPHNSMSDDLISPNPIEITQNDTTQPEKDEPSPQQDKVTGQTSSAKAKKNFLSTFASLKANIPTFGKVKTSIGIELLDQSINIAVLSNGYKELSRNAFSSINIPALDGDSPRFEDPEFIQFIKKNVAKSCSHPAKAEIWCSPNSQNAEILTIIIPKVPKKEIANAVFWSTKKETDYDMGKYVFDFSVRSEITEGTQKKIITTVYLFPIIELTAVKNLFQKAGITLTGITLPSLAIENLDRNDLLPANKETSVHLFLDREAAHIDIYHNRAMLFTRGIKTGITSIIEAIFDKAAEQDIFLDDMSAVNLIFSNTKTDFYQSKETDCRELNELAELLDIENLPVTTRLSRQLSRTFDYCSTHFKIPRASNLITSGPYVLKPAILKQLETDLDVTCHTINLQENVRETPPSMPANVPDEINPVTAYGLALSGKDVTQNFLYTFAHKKNFRQETRINQVIALATIISALVCGAFFSLQYQQVNTNKDTLQHLTTSLEDRYLKEPRSRDTSFSEMATKKIESLLKQNTKSSQRFQVMAAISSLLGNIPPEIKLTNLFIGPQASQKNKQSAAGPANSNYLTFEGVISGIPAKQNFILLDFQKKLYNLPLIHDASIANNESKMYEDQELLYFTIISHTGKDIL